MDVSNFYVEKLSQSKLLHDICLVPFNIRTLNTHTNTAFLHLLYYQGELFVVSCNIFFLHIYVYKIDLNNCVYIFD